MNFVKIYVHWQFSNIFSFNFQYQLLVFRNLQLFYIMIRFLILTLREKLIKFCHFQINLRLPNYFNFIFS